MTWTIIHLLLSTKNQDHISSTIFKNNFFIGRLTLGIFANNRFNITLYVQKNSRHHHKKTNADRPNHGISGMGMAALLFDDSLFSTHHYITAHQAY